MAILKNARSLTTEERFEEASVELEGHAWDAILFNETWRKEQEEFDILANGNLCFGSGGTPCKHGVGILLHKDSEHAVHSWVAIYERLSVLKLENKKFKMALVVVYMPHGKYAESDVQRIYDQLSETIRAARTEKRLVLISGD